MLALDYICYGGNPDHGAFCRYMQHPSVVL